MTIHVSCAISRQTILEDEKCRLFFVRAENGDETLDIVEGNIRQEHAMTPAPTGFGSHWKPLGNSFAATYVDRGGFALDPVDHERAKAFMVALKPHLCDVLGPKAGDRFSRVELDAKLRVDDVGAAWDLLVKAATRRTLVSRLSFEEGFDSPGGVAIAALHEITYGHLVSLRNVDAARNAAETIVDAAIRDIAKIGDNKAGPNIFHHGAHIEIERFWGEKTDRPFIDIDKKRVKIVLERLLNGDPDENRERVVDNLIPLLKDQIIFHSLDTMNIPLEPSRYAGSDPDDKAGKAYASMVSGIRSGLSYARASRDSETNFAEDDESPRRGPGAK